MFSDGLLGAEFLTWKTLLTFAGATAGTRYLTEGWKRLFGLSGRAILAAAILTGVALTVGAGLATGVRGFADVALLALNGIVVAQAATGLNEQIVRPRSEARDG